ncbi:NAD-dependent epimerase/dehydratase family protein [Dyella acidisoli]|uniref:GDP-6-deoxy-D-lyxo-4-hexulose reductase n=1 Tax=Dyella acidisoli TaxID=1867834 RepID=A0ABQ5XMV3_9GAMM|nr:NAD-dependent epimerase/dehydratase family protein [Dyella acidisoli]GLQ93022.1 GDP-6-deoxy-D-lyxo-4-hexulose reductase [Dyella acidisoli]
MASPSDRSQPVALVTGSLGFTGKYVSAELMAAGYNVVGLSHGPAAGNVEVDLCDREATIMAVGNLMPDVVIHLAAIAFVAHGDADAIYRTNIVGTRNLLEALASSSHRPRTVILASSANIYGNSDVSLLTEDLPAAPANDYAVSKLAMEQMARLWTDRLPIVLTRPFNYTGVGQSEKYLLPKIVSHFQRRAPMIELGNINVARDFQDVRFVASAYRKLLDADAVGEVVNLCSGHAYTLNEVIGMMEDLAGYRMEVRVNPAFVRANEVARLAGSNAKLARLIGPLDMIPLRQTLQWMYEASE